MTVRPHVFCYIPDMRAGSILIVDDDPVTLEVLKEALRMRMFDMTVETASSPQDALARIAVTDYDTILSDFKMPGSDGLELLARIVALRPHTPTLLMTGHDKSELHREALAAGAFAFLQKPLDRDLLIQLLKKALQFRHSILKDGKT